MNIFFDDDFFRSLLSFHFLFLGIFDLLELLYESFLVILHAFFVILFIFFVLFTLLLLLTFSKRLF